MKLTLFDYDLPKKLIAQFPARKREQSRLLVWDRATGSRTHGRFGDIVSHLRRGDALVVNNTKVFKARLLGKRATGGAAEVFLVRRVPDEPGQVWEALARPSRRLKEGEKVFFDSGRSLDLIRDLNNGRWHVGFSSATAQDRILSRHGHVPLPQYISREDSPTDIRRYQTVFARKDKVGAVAAPTAGFHLTRPLLEKIKALGVAVCEVTLHVGPGTFKPITVDDIEEHTVDPEYAELSPEVAATLSRTRAAGGRIFVVGTTSVRTLEAATVKAGEVRPFAGTVDLYIKPGHRFRLVDHLITNFHLPKSSLLVLVSAFAGRDEVMATYAEAVRREYRFYSYGDAMLIL